MRKLLLILTIVSFSVMVYAVGTETGSIITNISTVDGVNFTSELATNYTTVLTNYGGTWTGDADLGSGAIAGQPSTNTTSLTNLGNSEDIFVLDVPWTNYSGADAADPWTWAFYNNSTGAGNITKCTIAYGGFAQIDFVVTVSNAAQNSSWGDFALRAQVNDGTSNARYTNYVGDNGLTYCGDVGADATYGPSYIANTNREWLVTVAGPVIAITKEVDSVVMTNGLTGAYPGATITYKISVTNTGSASASGMYVSDAVPENTTLLSNADGGLKVTPEAADLSAATYALADDVTGSASDDAGAIAGGGAVNGAAASTGIEFTPGGTGADADTSGTEDGTLTNGNETICWYRVTID